LSVRLAALLITTVLAAPFARADEAPPNPSLVPPAPLHEQVLHMSGDPDRPADLVVTLYTPDGPGPFPLAVMNHGASGSIVRPEDTDRYRFTMSAYYFLSRGFAVALPMMRGFAGSEGKQIGYGCDLAHIALNNARDIAAVINDFSAYANIDTSRVIVAGQSFGGWNTLALGVIAPAGVRGLINFNGGIHSSSCNGDEGLALAEGARSFASQTHLQSIWFYGENDSLFMPNVWRSMHAAYTAAGGQAELVDIGRFIVDSHQLLSYPESIPQWAPKLDAFLQRIGLNGSAIHPAYMPVAQPRPTRYAAVEDIDRVPWINDAGRGAYRTFLSFSPPRVFLVAPGGQNAAMHGGFDPLGRGLAACRDAHVNCVPYAIDNDVVWTAPAAVLGPNATHFAAIDNAGAVPWVTEKGRDAYRNFLSHQPPRAFVIGTGGEFVVVFNSDPLARAMTLCGNAHIECRAYAVDNDVVWVSPPPLAIDPPATGFADINNVAAVPWVSPGSRALYAHFLTVQPPRAFVIARGGQAAAAEGGYNPLKRALEKCRTAGLLCRPYAVDNRVVWRDPLR
jgi:dienelactone hydrolase